MATGIFHIWLSPKANFQFRKEILALAKARADLAIKEQTFVREFPGLTIYVGQLPSHSKTMNNVVINDRRSPNESAIIVSRRGELAIDPSEEFLLFRLYDGVIDRFYQDRESVDTIFFATYDLKISPGEEFEDTAGTNIRGMGRQEMGTKELLLEAEKRQDDPLGWAYIYLLEWHRRFSFPMASLIMALIGMPLGASFKSKGRNFGVLIGLIIFVIYYAIFSIGWSFGESRHLSPFSAVWLANFLAFIVALWLLKGLNRSEPIDPIENFKRFWASLPLWSRGKER
jgi:lipopolysaccharide export system permease protein